MIQVMYNIDERIMEVPMKNNQERIRQVILVFFSFFLIFQMSIHADDSMVFVGMTEENELGDSYHIFQNQDDGGCYIGVNETIREVIENDYPSDVTICSLPMDRLTLIEGSVLEEELNSQEEKDQIEKEKEDEQIAWEESIVWEEPDPSEPIAWEEGPIFSEEPRTRRLKKVDCPKKQEKVEVVEVDTTPVSNTVVVIYMSNGGTKVPSQSLEKGEFVNRPLDPSKDGYVFVGWYEDFLFRDLFDFSKPLYESKTCMQNGKR